MTYLFNESSGGKLDGLRELPKQWVPAFFAISPELHWRWRDRGIGPGSATLEMVDAAERSWIESEVRRFGDQPQALSLIVRSNAKEEGLEQRGLLRSVRCDGTVEAILAAAGQVFEDAYNARAASPVSLIIQVHCSPVLKGHFSNERRISEEMRRWLCEMDSTNVLDQEVLPRVFKCRVENVKASGDRPLLCTNRRELVGNLRQVGKYLYDKKERRHLEWVWDGARLWIVQNDYAPDAAGDSPEANVTEVTPPVDAGALRVFRPFSTSDAKKWQKLKCVETFRALGLPTTPLYILQGGHRISRLATKGTIGGLSEDLGELTKGPLVIRTDIAGQTVLFANRTDCLSKAIPARKFLHETARDLLKRGVKPKQVCFIAHRFIPAHAAAFSMATPLSNRASVDALWGLPDGLEFCAHDSFEADVRTGQIVARKIRHKAMFLAAQPDESWKTTALGAPWDWRPSIDEHTVREIAIRTKRVAAALDTTVVIMCFARVPPGSGHPKLIPWRYTTEGAPRQVESGIGEYFLRQPFYVRNSMDIEKLKHQADPISSVILQPDGPHLRDKKFLEELGNVVRSSGLRIDLEGSPLSHTYYVLKRTGAHVACIDPMKQRSVRRKFAKLVRDKVPVRIQRQGEQVVVVNLPEGELRDVLRAKIVEEAMEVLSAASAESLQEEMADVLEVLIALCRIGGGSLKKLEKTAAKKRRSVGGFAKGMMLVETEETPLLEVQTGDGLFNTGGIRRTRHHQTIVAAGRRPKTRRDRIIIPLIPSVPDRLRGPSRIYFRNPDLEFEVWYREKSVDVILIREGSGVSSDQLVLPFAEELKT